MIVYGEVAGDVTEGRAEEEVCESSEGVERWSVDNSEGLCRSFWGGSLAVASSIVGIETLVLSESRDKWGDYSRGKAHSSRELVAKSGYIVRKHIGF